MRSVSPSRLLCPQSNKVPVVQHAHHMHPLTPLITYSNDHFSPGSPPGHLSPEIDPKTGEQRDRSHAGNGGLSIGSSCCFPMAFTAGPWVVGRGCSRWMGMGPCLAQIWLG